MQVTAQGLDQTSCLREPWKKNLTTATWKPAMANMSTRSNRENQKILVSVDLTVDWFLLFLVL